MASQPVMEAAARESRANAREDMAVLTSGAREKVDTAMASMQALGQKVLHPTDKAKKEEAEAAAEQQKKEAREKRDEIRSIAAQQAVSERAAARSLVAKGLAETGGTRYPVLTTGQPQQATSSTEQAVDPNYQPQQQLASTPQTLDPNYHPNHPPVMDTPLGSRPPPSTFQDSTRTNASVPLETIRVESPHQQRPMVGGATNMSMEAPVPVPPPSRQDRSSERVRGKEKVEEGVEDADYYPPTRIVQT